MLDFHSHILPEIDDGAQSVEESIAMLKMLKEQGVNTVALTSHYIATDESPQSFIERRTEAFVKLKEEIDKSGEEFPKLLLGAEVFYYPGILKMEELPTLTLENTNLLLLELPMAPWSDFMLRDIIDFANYSDIKLVIAHIERYIKFQKKGTIERLLDNNILLQVNASFFVSKKTRRKALKMLINNEIHFIGSDCHNTKYRPPKIKDALSIIEEKYSKELVDDFINDCNSLI